MAGHPSEPSPDPNVGLQPEYVPDDGHVIAAATATLGLRAYSSGGVTLTQPIADWIQFLWAEVRGQSDSDPGRSYHLASWQKEFDLCGRIYLGVNDAYSLETTLVVTVYAMRYGSGISNPSGFAGVSFADQPGRLGTYVFPYTGDDALDRSVRVTKIEIARLPIGIRSTV